MRSQILLYRQVIEDFIFALASVILYQVTGTKKEIFEKPTKFDYIWDRSLFTVGLVLNRNVSSLKNLPPSSKGDKKNIYPTFTGKEFYPTHTY